MSVCCVINGRFLAKPMQGIPRYVREIIVKFDNYVQRKDDVVLIVPKGSINVPILKNIHIVEKQYSNAYWWDFYVAERFACKRHAVYLNMACPGLYTNSIVAIHDIRAFSNLGIRTETLLNFLKLHTIFWMAKFRSKFVVTVSNTIKQALINHGIDGERINVIGNGWEHLERIEPDNSVFSKFRNLQKGKYYLSVSSVAPHKNLNWIIENAKEYPSCQYVIVGGSNNELWPEQKLDLHNISNIIYLGFQSDEVVKALLLNAKALIFPSLYEGFGIPPLEALACGTKAIVADIPVMREIYGEAVEYLNPNDSKVNLNDVNWEKDRSIAIEQVLSQYTWKNAAYKWYKLMKKLCKIK